MCPFSKTRTLVLFVGPIASLVAPACSPSTTRSYPAKAIEVIVPFAPAGGADLAARVVADALSREWRVPVNVVNKEGGNTVVGTLEMMNSRADGYTVLADNPSSSAYQVILPDLPYEITDRVCLGAATAGALAFAVSASSSWRNLDDVTAAIRADPGGFRWGSLGGVSVADFALQQYFADANIDPRALKTVRFKGASDAVVALAGGHIDFTSAGLPAVQSYVQAGTLRLVALTDKVKDIDVSTATEQGYRRVTAVTWLGYTAPPRTPPEIVEAWERALQRITSDSAFQQRLERIGYYSRYQDASSWRAVILSEAAQAKTFFAQGRS